MTFTRRQVEIRLMLGDAYRPALGSPEGPEPFRLRATRAIAIALAVFLITYFAAQMLRAVLA